MAPSAAPSFGHFWVFTQQHKRGVSRSETRGVPTASPGSRGHLTRLLYLTCREWEQAEHNITSWHPSAKAWRSIHHGADNLSCHFYEGVLQRDIYYFGIYILVSPLNKKRSATERSLITSLIWWRLTVYRVLSTSHSSSLCEQSCISFPRDLTLLLPSGHDFAG